MKKIFFLGLLFVASLASAQNDEFLKSGPTSASTPEEFEAEYKKNIRKSKINGVYIPKNLKDAFRELVALSPEESIIKYKEAPEEVVAKKLHHGLGKWMIAKWSFYNGSRLSHRLKRLGLSHPDDMAQFVLRTFHRHLNNLPLEEKVLALEYVKMRKAESDERRKDAKILKTEKKKIPKN
jgi:hypothetical protein